MSSAESNDNIFGERLLEAREVRGLTQTDLAKISGLQPAAIGHFEKNRRKPSFANIRTLAKALNVSSDFLLGRTSGYGMAGVTTAFRNEENLSDSDRRTIQMMIDTLAKKSEG